MSKHCRINPSKCHISPKNALSTNAKFSRLRSRVTDAASAYRALVLKLPHEPKAGWRKTSAGKFLLHSMAKLNIRCGGSRSWLCAHRAQHKPLFLSKGRFHIISTACTELEDYGWYFPIGVKQWRLALHWNLVGVTGLTPPEHTEKCSLLFFHLEKATEGTSPSWETWP